MVAFLVDIAELNALNQEEFFTIQSLSDMNFLIFSGVGTELSLLSSNSAILLSILGVCCLDFNLAIS
jgi:hypothetical protein